MNPNENHQPPMGRPFTHPTFIQLLEKSLDAKENRFAREAALVWLSTFPGDLPVRLLYAQAIHQLRGPEQALDMVEILCKVDPFWLAAWTTLCFYRQEAGLPIEDQVAAVIALDGSLAPSLPRAPWGIFLLKARQSLAAGKTEEAEIFVQRALLANPPTSMPAVLQLEIMRRSGNPSSRALQGMADHYAQLWPDCLACSLIQADALMAGGESEKAVALLHKVAAEDITGQVAARIWGFDHPYRSLWPASVQAGLDLPIPARVAAGMGWNILPSGGSPNQGGARSERVDDSTGTGAPQSPPEINPDLEKIKHSVDQPEKPAQPADSTQADIQRATQKSGTPESLKQIQAEIERVAAQIKKPNLAQADGRYPVYVVLTTKQGLTRQYSNQAAGWIITACERLVKAVRRDPHWDALLLLADDGPSTAPWGIKPASAKDPWAIKLLLRDLDEALRRRGEMIGAVMIVGSPQIVPFHHLPNPVDDEDVDVPSDNPYGTRDENYFIPEWPVGRLPGSAASDPAPLLDNLYRVISLYESARKPLPWYRRIFSAGILGRIWSWIRQRDGHIRPSFGYTAAAWRKASLSVFRPIGEARSLLASPPTLAEHLPWNGLTPARLGYYNLHGLVDASEWFGQRDPGQAYDGPDYPVALRPQDVMNSGRSPRVIFSEACFGAHILGKGVDQALALKFLQSGTQVVVGSTCTAYGSIASPLIAADLLGHSFWRYLQQGMMAGEALRRAKIHLADEMHRRQGYLDGEDQKTLISFILYGDPLAQPHVDRHVHKSIIRSKEPAVIKTVCDRTHIETDTEIPEGVLLHVKQVVEQYLPGMSDAALSYSQEKIDCTGDDHTCPTSQLHAKNRTSAQAGRRVVTLSKQVILENQRHPQYARMTLDQHGKVVKLAVSR